MPQEKVLSCFRHSAFEEKNISFHFPDISLTTIRVQDPVVSFALQQTKMSLSSNKQNYILDPLHTGHKRKFLQMKPSKRSQWRTPDNTYSMKSCPHQSEVRFLFDFSRTMISFFLPILHYGKCQMLIGQEALGKSCVMCFTKFTGIPNNEIYWSYRQHQK